MGEFEFFKAKGEKYHFYHDKTVIFMTDWTQFFGSE